MFDNGIALKGKTRDRIIELLGENPKHTTRTLAEEIGIMPKGIERHLAISNPKAFSTASAPTKAANGKLLSFFKSIYTRAERNSRKFFVLLPYEFDYPIFLGWSRAP